MRGTGSEGIPLNLTRGEEVDWVSMTNELNEVALRLGRAVFPNFRLGLTRYVRVMYCFASGEISIQFEDKLQTNSYIRLSEHDFKDFLGVEHVILPLLRIIEGQSTLNLEDYISYHSNVITRDPLHPKRVFVKINHRILATVQSKLIDGVEGAVVELRAISPPGEEEAFLNLPYRLLNNHFTVKCGVYNYFSKILREQVNDAIGCWREVRSKTGRSWIQLVGGVQQAISGGGEVMTPVYVGHSAGLQ